MTLGHAAFRLICIGGRDAHPTVIGWDTRKEKASVLDRGLPVAVIVSSCCALSGKIAQPGVVRCRWTPYTQLKSDLQFFR
jgi:hypothetical protein